MNVSAATVRLRVALTLALWSSASASAVVVVYEGNDFPENLGWQRLGNAQVELSVIDGWFVQMAPTTGQDYYRTELGAFVGVDAFFVEWRAVTDYPAWLLDEWQVPAALSASGDASTYHTTFTDTLARTLRHLVLPSAFVEIEMETPHEYRVEIRGDEFFAWYIDGQMADSGVPVRAYPDSTAFVVWGVHSSDVVGTTAWDFVRFGRIPDDASGDYDSDDAVGLFDYYFVHDCLTKDGPGIFAGPQQNAGPGCRFTDFDAGGEGDADADLLDFAEFSNQFTGPLP